MNKRFLKVAFLCLVACSVSASFTSCKDYDEDINSLRQETSGLSGQLSALEEALNSTKTELTNAKKAADDAMAQAKAAAEAAQAADAAAKAAQAAGDSAKAEAEAAKAAAEAANAQALAAEALAKEAQAAAAKAKEEAIAEAVAKCQELMASTVSDEEFNQKVSELEGMIDAVEAGLNTLDGKVGTIDEKVKALTEWQTSVDLQLKTLETLQAEVGTLKSDVEEVKSSLSGLEGTVSGLDESLTALQGTVDSLEETIADLQELVDTKASKEEVEAAISSMETGLKEYVNGEISDLDKELKSYIDSKLGAYATTDALNTAIEGLKQNMVTLADALTWRLTSLTLIPDVFEDGIPTMSFRTLVYTPQTLNADKELVDVTGAKPVSLGNDETTVSYYVNPSKITTSYIGKPSFVTAVASTRAGSLIDVKDYSIDGGKLTVTAVRTSDNAFNEGLTASQINIFALKVPLAEAALTEAEKGTEVAVYSQFAKFTETTFLPHLASKAEPTNDLASYREVYGASQGEEILLDAKFDETTDLVRYVTPAYEDGSLMELDYLKSFGVTLRFQKVRDPYLLGASNTDQQEFYDVDEFGKLTAKNLSGGEDLSSAIGREPIVCVQMVDTLNGKNNTVDQRYFKVRFVKEKLEPINVSYAFAPFKLTAAEEYAFTMGWEDMTSLILEKTGLSYDEFKTTYNKQTYEGDGTVKVTFDSTAPGSSPITWTLTDDNIADVEVGKEKTLDGVLTLSAKNGLAPEIKINLSVKVSVELPTMTGLNTLFWNNDAYQLKHIPYGADEATAQASYSNEILEGFNLIDKVYMLSTKDGYKWEFQFSEEGQPKGYAPKGDVPSTLGRYLIATGQTNSAAAIDYTPTDLFASATPNPLFRLGAATYAKPLVGQIVSVTAWVKFNEYNTYALNSYKIEILPPLNFTQDEPAASFTDWKKDSKVSVAGLIKATENGTDKPVVVGGTGAMAKYYGLDGGVTYHVDDALIGMKDEGGNLVVDDNLSAIDAMPLAAGLTGATITYDGTNLVFTHTTGAKITKACNIFVPFTVTHTWGEYTGYVKVRLNPLS